MSIDCCCYLLLFVVVGLEEANVAEIVHLNNAALQSRLTDKIGCLELDGCIDGYRDYQLLLQLITEIASMIFDRLS